MLLDGDVWMRLRGPGSEGEAAVLCTRLEEALVAGLSPGDVTVESAGKAARLLAKGKLLLAISPEQAATQKSSADGLAQRWSQALRTYVAAPYVAVAAGAGLDVPVGEARTLGVGGPGALSAKVVSLSPAVVEVGARGTEGVSLRGLAPGEGAVEVSTPDDRARVVIRVKHWAAVAPATVQAVVTSPLLRDEWDRFSEYAVMSSVVARPSARVRLDHQALPWPNSLARLSANGADLLSLSRRIEVKGQVQPTRLPAATHVLVSNYPERVNFSNVLMRDLVEQGEPVRILWHHANDSPQALWFGVRVHNVSDETAYFAWNDAFAGPVGDEVYVGHLACRLYLDQLRRGAALLLSLPAQRWVEFSTVRTTRSKIVSGLACMSLLGGGPLIAEVVAHSDAPPPAAGPVAANLRNEPRLKPFRFEGQIEQSAEYRVGGPWTFMSIGKQPRLNEHGILLHGNYGVLYRVRFDLRNPTVEGQELELVVRSGGGAARGTFMVNDELLETPVLRATQEHVLTRWHLAAGAERSVPVLTMPQSGSNYPVTLIVRPRSRK